MIYVGLTGGIGSGKSTVANFFGELGVPIYNSDEKAKWLMNSSNDLKKAIKTLLGPKAYTDERLNKSYVAKQIFGNNILLQKINELVHPAVRDNFYHWAKEQKSPYVIQEAAILFENGSYKNYDSLILVTAPKHLRIERVAARDKIDSKQILQRMAVQWEDERKVALSDYVIENTDLRDTQNQVLQIHKDLLKSIS